MKKGIVSGIVRSALAEGAGIEQVMALAATSGFDGIEVQHGAPPCEFTEDASDKEMEGIRKAADKAGIEIPSVMPSAQELGAADAEQRKHGIQVLEKVCRRAVPLGARTVLIVPGRVSERCTYEQNYNNARDSLKELADRIADITVTLAVENVWNRFLYSPLEFARFIDEIGRPNVRAYFDAGNIMLFGFPEQWIRILGKRIDKVHVKDYLRDRPGAAGFANLLEGDVPWADVKKALDEVGYDDYVTAEVAAYRSGRELGLKATAAALDYIIGL